MQRQVDLGATVKTLEGEKQYVFVALTRRDAMEVFHGVLSTVIGAVTEISTADKDNATDEVFSALRKIDFETVWSLASKLLKFAMLDGVEIKDLDDTDYFDDRPEELYLAVFHAIRLNWPGVFEKLKNALSGLDLGSMLPTGLSREESKTL